jgi:hypothetical protein
MGDIKEKRKLFHTLLHSNGLMKRKATILSAYGVESTLDLTESELDELIRSIKNGTDTEKHEKNEELRAWRSKILTRLQKLGIYATNDDWDRVNAYLKDNRIAGKYLFQMNVDEMTMLDNKLRCIYDKQQKQARQIKRLQQMN